MDNIAGTAGGKCFERGISTMRLALGYEEGLPLEWNCPFPTSSRGIVDMLPIAFPGRAIRVWHSDWGIMEGLRSPQWFYMGTDYETTEESDNWLAAFAYVDRNDTKGHFVIGEPATYGEDHQIAMIVAVSLEKET